MPITNERIRQMVFDAQTNPTDKFIVLALEALLESQVGAGATDDILDTFIPVQPTMQQVLFGHKLGDYAGLSRTRLKEIYGFTDGQVDDIFAAIGATEGLSLDNPNAAEAPEQPSQKEFVDEDLKATPAPAEAKKKAESKKAEPKAEPKKN